ncbi:hypothetical protein KFD70_25700 [Bacillus pfraonensis]|uniref:hypothetical protein n=1 Tax=Bacillus TaxID=1386 RepID=UPI002A57F016|nr:hypothetical protein [Bacillus pseudomycoides]
MNLEALFLRDKEEFEGWNEKLNEMFHLGFNLPYQVFKKGYGNYMFEEFDFLMEDGGWDEVKKIAQMTNDSFVVMGVLNPHPVKYYYKEFGYYNWLKLPFHLSGNQYIDVLDMYPVDSPADSIMDNSSMIVWFSPSMEWIIIGDREYGIGILTIKDGSKLKHNFTSSDAWKEFDDDVLSWISLNFEDENIYKEFIRTFSKNYSNNSRK